MAESSPAETFSENNMVTFKSTVHGYMIHLGHSETFFVKKLGRISSISTKTVAVSEYMNIRSLEGIS